MARLSSATDKVMLGRLNHVAIAVPNLEAAARIYREALGASVSVLIGRSILRPLSSLELTANKVSSGDITARALVSGPAELSKLGGAPGIGRR